MPDRRSFLAFTLAGLAAESLQSVDLLSGARVPHQSTGEVPAPAPVPGQDQLGLTGDRMRCATLNEWTDVPFNSAVTVLDVTGPGCVHRLWLAWGGTQDARIQVSYDGASTPAIDVELGTLAGTHWGQPTYDAWGHEHISVTRNPSGVGLNVTFKMPFGDGILVKVHNPAAGDRLYSMAWYSLGDSYGSMRLKASAGRYSDGTYKAQIPETSYDYLDVAGRGWLVGVHFSGGPIGSLPAGWDWLERNIVVFIDGETVPSITSSGTEDFFGSAYYFNLSSNAAGSWFSGPAGGHPDFFANMAIDLQSALGGIKFDSHIKVQGAGPGQPWSGNRSGGNIGLAYLCLYYSL